MGPLRNDRAAPAPPDSSPAEGTVGGPVPEACCRLCWHDRYVWRGGVWMLEHRGPFADCTHSCHDDEGLLPSVS
jgi:hypothetical protein